MAKIFDYPVTIKEHHLDTFGHVNNAVYLELLEEARWELITQRGYGIKEIMAAKKGPVILSVELNFSRELKNREDVVIRTEMVEYRGKVGKLKQVFINSQGKDACTAVFTFGLFDLDSRKLIDPTPEWLNAVGLTE